MDNSQYPVYGMEAGVYGGRVRTIVNPGYGIPDPFPAGGTIAAVSNLMAVFVRYSA
jgi:hypothetical protein